MKELFTQLNDRVLRFDGVSIVEAEQLSRLVRAGTAPKNLRVLCETPEVQQFNSLVSEVDKIKEFSDEPLAFNFFWQLPPEFLALDIEQFVLTAFSNRLPQLNYDPEQTELAINRVAQELKCFTQRGLTDLLRTIIFVLHRFRETGQVWGVGRGSSCASYILFLLGLHVVDPIKFDISLEEFMH